ncbi:MAG: hypothetical protein E7256_11965 [Lachnospiraceae bacterium]|nr:hypothetical protein [Lachnospiraceae bacterium]
MAANLLSYSGITTKSKGMQSKLMKDAEYEELMQMNSVRDFVLYLKGKEAYQSYFEPMNENSVHRGQIEKVLYSALFQSYASLYRFADSRQKKQLNLIYFHYEVRMLSECLKHLYDPNKEVNVKAYKEAFHNHIRIPIDKLMAAETLEEFRTCLFQTPYEGILDPLLNEDKPSLFDLLMLLNGYYYKTLWKQCKKTMDSSQADTFMKCVGTKIDVENIMLIYRCKKYYQVDAAKITSIILPISYRLKKEELTALIHAETVTEFIEILKKTDYRIEKDTVSQNDMERAYYHRITKAYTDSKAKNPLGMAPIFSYLYKKERELDNLTTILEGIRYGMNQETIRTFLIN